MERLYVHAKFHTAHRQLGFPGHCKYVHGHTWHGTITITAPEDFARDELDMSIDFGELKSMLRQFDHKIIVTPDDETFNNAELFEPDGVIVMEGKSPSVENVATLVCGQVADHLAAKYPGLGKRYTIDVLIRETENNHFGVTRDVVI